MNKIDVIRKLLEFDDTLGEELKIRIVTRDENGVVISAKECSIDSIGNFLHHSCINITEANIEPEVKQ